MEDTWTMENELGTGPQAECDICGVPFFWLDEFLVTRARLAETPATEQSIIELFVLIQSFTAPLK